MNASDLVDFLGGKLSAPEFASRIDSEAATWASRLSERGRSAPVSLLGMRTSVDVTPQSAATLLDAYIANELSATSFAYALDALLSAALLLEDHFRWTSLSVREAMEHVLGSDYPKRMNKQRAWQVRAELKALSTS